jgi:hypothetical protein
MDIITPLKKLNIKRKIIHSKVDFQFSLAWEIQKAYPSAKVRLEYSTADIESTMHIEILVILDDIGIL